MGMQWIRYRFEASACFCSAALFNLQPAAQLEAFSVYFFHLVWWLLHELSKPGRGKWDAFGCQDADTSVEKRNLWNPMVLLHVCHPKESCLGEPQCHQEHLGNSLRCLYNINLSHISIAGSCVIISSHVMSCLGGGPSQSRRLVLSVSFSSAQSTGNLHPLRCALCFQGTGWKRLSCRVRGWSTGEQVYGRKIWQVKPAAFEMQMDLSSPRCHRAWQTLHSLLCDHLTQHCKEKQT